MELLEKALIAAGVDVAEKMEAFLKSNGVNPGNIKNYEIIQEQKKKAMEITILKKPGFFGKIIGKKGEKIATMGVYFDGLVNDFIDKIKADEAKKEKLFMGTAAEDIKAGDIVDFDPKNGIIKKAKQEVKQTTHKVNIEVWVDLSEAEKQLKKFAEKVPNLEKPLKSKKATDEKNTPKKSLKKKKRKTSSGTKWKDSI